MLRLRRPALCLLIAALTFWPTIVVAQGPKAGVVTTLEGNVTAARRPLPRPIPLKFKDDVFLRDKITTGDQSLARLLLGGKAVVTIRERSILTVTELPGRSTIELESGKIGLAAARERMRAGEVIDVRAPNAVVAVRGTVLIAEVSRTSAQAGGTPPVPVTEVHLVSGTAEATTVNPATGAPTTAPFTLTEFQKFRVAGGAPPVIGTFTRDQLGQIQSGLKPKSPQHIEAVNADQLKAQLMGATSVLLTTVLGGGAEFVEPAVAPPPPPPTPANILPGGEDNLTEESNVLPSNIPQNIIINPALDAFTNLTASEPTPVVQTSGVTLPQSSELAPISGSAFTVQTTDTDPPALTRPLFDTTNSNFRFSGNLLNVLGPFSSTTSLPVLSFDPTTITTGSDFIRVAPGGTLSVNSSLLSDSGGTLTSTGGHFINVMGGGTLSSTGPSPLVQLNNTRVNVAGDFLRVGDEATGSATTEGSILDAMGASLTVGGSVIRITGPGSFGEGEGTLPASLFESTSSTSLLRLGGATVHSTGGDVVSILDAGRLRLRGAGSLLVDAGSTFTLSGGDVLRINGGSSLVSASAQSLLQFMGSNVLVTGTGEGGGGDLVRVRESSRVELQGPLLRASDSIFELGGILLRVVHESTLTSESPEALIQLSGGSLSTGKDLVRIGSPEFSNDGSMVTVPGTFVSLRNFPEGSLDVGSGTALRIHGGSSLRAGGPVFELENVDLTLNRALTLLENGSTITTTAGPFAKISGGSLTAEALIGTDGDGNTINLAGPLLAATDSAVTLTTDAISVPGGSSSLTSTTTQAFVSLVKTPNSSSDSSLTAAGSLLAVRFGGRADLDGPFLSAVRSDVTATNAIGVFDGGIVTSGSSSPFLSLDASTLTIQNPVEAYGGHLVIVGAGGPSGGTLQLGGRLLDLSNGSDATVAGSLIEVTNGGRFTVPAGTTLVSATGGSSLTVGSGLDLTSASLDLGQTGTVLSLASGSQFTVAPGPVVKITGGSLTADLLARSDGLANRFNITGTLFDLTNAIVTLRQIAQEPADSTDTVILNLAPNQPFIRMSASTLTMTGLNADLIEFGENLPLGTDGESRTTPGIALRAETGSTLNLQGSLLHLNGIISTADAALVQLANTTVNQTNTARALVVVDPNGGTTTMKAPLLTASGSTIAASGGLAHFQNATLTSNTISPFFSFNPSTVTSAGSVILVDGLTLSLQSSLLFATDTTFNATNPAFSAFPVINGATVTTTSTSNPFLEFVGTVAGLSKVTAARVFLPLATSSGDQPSPSMTLSSQLLRAILTDFRTGDPTLNTFPFLFVGDGATLTGPQSPGSQAAADPLVTFSTSSLEAAGGFLTLRRSKGPAEVDRSRVILQGPLLEANNSDFTTLSSAHPSGGPCCSFVFVGEGAQLTNSGLTALLRFNNSVFPNIGGSLVNVADSASQLDSVSRPAFLNLAGRLVEDFGGQYTLNGAVLRIRNGSEVHGSGRDAFLSFTNSRLSPSQNGNMSLLNQGSINESATGGGGFGIGDPRNTTLLSLTSPLLFAINSTFNTGTFSTFIGVRDGARVVSSGSGTGAFIQLDNSAVTASANFFAASHFTVDSFGNNITGSRAPISVNLNRPLLSAVLSDISAILGLVSIGDNTTFTSSTPNPLIELTGLSVEELTSVTVGGTHPITGQPAQNARLFSLFERSGFTPSMTLAGPLFKSDFADISSTSDAFGVFRAPLDSLTDAPFIELSASTLTAGGAFFIATGSLAATTFAGPLARVMDSSITVAQPFLAVTFGADVLGTTGSGLPAFIDLSRSDATSTASSFIALCCGTPAAVLSLEGTLLTAADSTLTMARSLMTVSEGASFEIRNDRPAFRFTNSTLRSTTPGSPFIGILGGARPPVVSLRGALFEADSSEVMTPADLLLVDNARLNSTGSVPFVSLANSDVSVGGAFARLLNGGTLTVTGELLSAVDSTIALGGDVLNASGGATLVANLSETSYALVSLTGGSLAVGTLEAPAQIFNLAGRPGNVVDDPEADPVTGSLPTGLRIGQDQPLQHGGGGALLAMSNVGSAEVPANVSGSIVKLVDAQLLAATMPAVANLTSTTLTTGSHAVDLVRNAKLDVGLADVVRLTNSAMTVGNGISIAHLANVNGSRFNAGTLAALAGGSTLNILNGALLNLMNGGIANFGTSLVSFTGTGNTINVANSFVPTTFISGIPIFVAPGATFNFSINSTPLAGLGTNGAININGAALQPNATGSLVAVQGTGGTLKIGTNGTPGTIVGPTPTLPGGTVVVPPPTGGPLAGL